MFKSHIVNNAFEYPIIQNVASHPLSNARMGEFKQDLDYSFLVSSYGEWQKEAYQIDERSQGGT